RPRPLVVLHDCPSLCTGPAPPKVYPLSLHDALPISTFVRVASVDAAVGAPVAPPPAAGELRIAGVPASRATAVARVREVAAAARSEEHTSELQSRVDLVCRLLLEKKKEQTQARRNVR